MKTALSKDNGVYIAAAAAAAAIALAFGPSVLRAIGKRTRFTGEDEVMTGRSVLIYDGQCPVCTRSMEWIERHADRNSFEMLACQAGETRRRFPQMPEEVCMNSLQLVLPDSRILSGADSLPLIVKRLKRYRFLVNLFRVPGAMRFSRWFYHWFTDHRQQISNVLFPQDRGQVPVEP